jgi:hypothetical protein
MAINASRIRHGLIGGGGVLVIVSALLSGAPLGAQTTSVLELKSALFSVFGTPQLTVAEVGSLTSSSTVQIEFRDARDNRLSIKTGTLNRKTPVRARLAVPGGQQVRVIVRITGLVASAASRPVVSLEDLAPGLNLVLETQPPCAPRHSVGGGAQGNCGGWQIDQFATGSN